MATSVRAQFKRFFDETGGVDQVGVEERVAKFATRSIKKQSKIWGLKTAVSMIDLTTLEGKDTPGKVASLCAKARRPSDDPEIPSVAAVCIYPTLVKNAARLLAETPIKIASVATGFPSGQSPLKIRLAEVKQAVADGADEVDMVINRGAFLAGDFQRVQDEISAVVEACGDDFYLATGTAIRMKPAGGIRTAKQALHYLVAVKETLGDTWLNSSRYRFGASSLLNDLLRQIEKEKTGAYQAPYYFTEAAESY